jgi:hypothetical protein
MLWHRTDGLIPHLPGLDAPILRRKVARYGGRVSRRLGIT